VWHVVIQIRKSDSVFGADRLTNNDLIDVIKLISIIVRHWKRRLLANEKKDNYQITHPVLLSLINGSNFGPPGIVMFRAFPVKNFSDQTSRKICRDWPIDTWSPFEAKPSTSYGTSIHLCTEFRLMAYGHRTNQEDASVLDWS
jgi:hypothetical protein